MFALVYLPGFDRDLKKLPVFIRNHVLTAAEKLSNNPFPSNSRKLSASENIYRLRMGNYRLLYEIENRRKIIYLTRVAHRKDIYQ